MLSVVLYGRNDSHGYNLHKRAAISLNAIAELLTDPDDEILFVDYNTPDDLPTFPEAIADTLTQKAVARLRILRVRPETHRTRFAARTHLVALEPIARNVAIRRSNPANTWVLSTNTDMIFCPTKEGESLSSIVAQLEDGFYHLPRFELPEGLWETLDRMNPTSLISSARDWGRQFRLNEIVFSGSDNIYDGPGDFQLFQRQDLFSIGGFHEDMIRGWHLDANIARRMRMLKGRVSSVLDHLVGYHCDHTRQASPYHKADRLENDSIRFVDEVASALADKQMDIWGLADLEIENLTLNEASGARYRRALEATQGAPLDGFLETSYTTEQHGRLNYDVHHVLPYLFDLVSCIPQNSLIGYVDARADTFQAFAKGWQAIGGGKIAIPKSAAWLDPEEAIAEILPDVEWAEKADLFIFGIGAEHAQSQAELSPSESTRLWLVDQAFRRASNEDLMRLDKGGAARRAIVINGLHNFFECQVINSVAITLTPFSSRIRHGYFADRSAARVKNASPAELSAMSELGALEPPSRTNIAQFQTLLAYAERVQDAQSFQLAATAATELSAYLRAGLIDAPDAPAWLDKLAPPIVTSDDVIAADAGLGAPNRLIRFEDWDDLEWSELAKRLFTNRDHADLFGREAWTWERVTLVQNLLAAIAPHTSSTVLVVGKYPERLAFVLAHLGFAVDIADPEALAVKRLEARDWRGEFASEGWVAPTVVGLIDARAPALAKGFRYDAVLLPQNALFALGTVGVADLLRALTEVLQDQGHLGMTVQVQPFRADERLQNHALPFALTQGAAFVQALEAFTELEAVGTIDWCLTPRTAARLAPAPGVASPAPPALIFGILPEVEASAALSLRKSGGPADWEALQSVLAQGAFDAFQRSTELQSGVAASQLFTAAEIAQHPPMGGVDPCEGPSFRALAAADGILLTPSLMRVLPDCIDRLVGTAQLGMLIEGVYELVLELHVKSVAPGPLLSIGIMNAAGLAVEQTTTAQGVGVQHVCLSFKAGADTWRGNVALLKAVGGSEFDIVDLIVR